MVTKRRAKASGRSTENAAAGGVGTDRILPVLYRITRGQRDAVQRAAWETRDRLGGAGRVNASAVLRALLDEWIAGGCKLPTKVDDRE
jgi:hypothetical protein